uniref:ultraviolet-B receptor UVR8-like isoform X2 n=1 Tax=Erigeron canadensis TaxID=72917 RepID=UPI001CB996AE|nr:ultraviolet-B receptor UVR8-like isoform X2 [Erigeron canadensis]
MNVENEDVKMKKKSDEKENKMMVYMWGYLPGALPQRSPLLSPFEVRLPPSIDAGRFFTDVCGGGCGFAMAISDTGKLVTWGSTDDLGQSYLTSGKHGETPEPFPLPKDVSLVRAAAGWAHCVCVTVAGEVYTWGWKECVPSGKVVGDPNTAQSQDKDLFERQNPFLTEQVSSRSQGSRSSVALATGVDGKPVGDEGAKRRRVSSTKQAAESSSSGDEPLSALPCLVALNPGVRIATVAAGGRHTLALSDIGQVWGWGYGGEGQLGLGSRIRMVSSPHPIPCIATSAVAKDRSAGLPRGTLASEGHGYRVPGNYIKGIACGGRHSAVITDAGALMTFGWGLYGQCGQGSTDDELSPTCVSSLLGIPIHSVAAGLWHTTCISGDGDVYAFGGNQFGQLGTGSDQAETLPRLLDAPSLENERAKVVSCGARHSAVVTDGKVFCWGWNKYGQLGLGDVIDRNIPTQVALEGFVPRVVACGWWHTLLLAESLT